MHSLIFTGGPVVTMDPAFPDPEAVGLRNGRIMSIGLLSDVMEAIGPESRIIDLEGNTLLPGFIDAHSHILWAAKTRGAPVVDIRPEIVPTYRAALGKIRRRVSAATPGEFLLFFGLDAQLHVDMVAPTRALLDEIAPNNPIGIQTSNCHALFMNSRALKACGINASTPTPIGSVIDRDESGHPTGRVAEAITWSVLDRFYESWGNSRLNTQFEAMIRQFIANGITTVTEHLYLPYYKSYYQWALERDLPMPRVAAYQQAVTADMKVENLKVGDDRLWMAGIKIHADGSPFVGNIWISKPYLETEITLEKMNLRPGHVGGTNYPQEYFERMVHAYFSQGWQMSIHTQGDRTIDMVLDVLEEVLVSFPRPDHRFRLEHCALMRPDQIERAHRLEVLCSFFINHITYWGVPIEDALFGSERAARYMPAGSAVRSGMQVSLHADTPMTDPSCLALMAAATLRKASDGRCLGAEERIDSKSALKSVTIDAAFQIGMEDHLGSLTPGKHADLVILDRNPLEVPHEELEHIGVLSTYLAGSCVFER
ncbi:MAG: amidohydrolase family protein [Gammaproteobacteria bacterium]|nr:amidohydrolase family protein [Gammaproteobacteria bacterium]